MRRGAGEIIVAMRGGKISVKTVEIAMRMGQTVMVETKKAPSEPLELRCELQGMSWQRPNIKVLLRKETRPTPPIPPRSRCPRKSLKVAVAAVSLAVIQRRRSPTNPAPRKGAGATTPIAPPRKRKASAHAAIKR